MENLIDNSYEGQYIGQGCTCFTVTGGWQE